ncbi:MAG: SPOR domain-containing protein [Neisseria sp.]|nr:SPOR domain-containing protein [Neisseria sp.]
MQTTKPYGRGLTAFILGLLLATAIIGSLVFILNKNPNADFKQPVVETELPPPEILTPHKKQPPAEPAQPPEQPSSGTPVIVEQPKKTEPPKKEEEEAEPEEQTDDDIDQGQEQPRTQVKPEKKQTGKNTGHKPAHKEPKQPPKPTPEQILNSGSIEKAREAAAREAQGGKTAQTGKGKIIVQAGSYGSRDKAESQRDKLRAAGVQARIETATVDGKTMYRVQTPPMNAQAAAQTREQLDRQGIDSFARPVR